MQENKYVKYLLDYLNLDYTQHNLKGLFYEGYEHEHNVKFFEDGMTDLGWQWESSGEENNPQEWEDYVWVVYYLSHDNIYIKATYCRINDELSVKETIPQVTTVYP